MPLLPVFKPANRNAGYTLALVALIVCFAAVRIPDLALPYFWDELGVYAPGALRLHDTHLSLMPGALDPELSRGHPLLCVFLYASWMRIFGDSVIAAHSFSLLLACATLTALYGCTADLLGRKVALPSVALTAAQPIFYTLSGMIFPEMLLTLLTILAARALLRKRWWLYLASTSLAILTKESALIILPAACCFLLLEKRDSPFPARFRRLPGLLLAASPALVFMLFLLVQKAQNGWYLFPLHLGYIDFSADSLVALLPHVAHDVFLEQGRWLTGIPAIGALCYAFSRPARQTVAGRTLRLYLLLIVTGILFAGVNFYLARYMLYLIPFVVTAGVQGLLFLAEKLPARRRVPALAFFCAAALSLSAANMDCKAFKEKCDMAYRHIVMNELEAIRWARQQPWHNTTVGANFPVFQALQDPRNGYVARPWPYSENCKDPTAYAILWHSDEKVPVPNDRPYHVVRRFDRLFSHVSIIRFDAPSAQ